MVYKTIKKNGNKKYKNQTIIILLVASFFANWCIRDYFNIFLLIHEKILYISVIIVLLWLMVSRIMKTWFNIIVTKKTIMLWDVFSGIKIFRTKRIKSITICKLPPDGKLNGSLCGRFSENTPNVVITVKDDYDYVICCQTPQKLYDDLEKTLKSQYSHICFSNQLS